MSVLPQRKDIRMNTLLKNIDLRNISIEQLKDINLDYVDIEVPAPDFEPNRQYYFMAKCRKYVKEKSAELGRPLTYVTVTFGCQMNVVTQKWGVSLLG